MTLSEYVAFLEVLDELMLMCIDVDYLTVDFFEYALQSELHFTTTAESLNTTTEH